MINVKVNPGIAAGKILAEYGSLGSLYGTAVCINERRTRLLGIFPLYKQRDVIADFIDEKMTMKVYGEENFERFKECGERLSQVYGVPITVVLESSKPYVQTDDTCGRC